MDFASRISLPAKGDALLVVPPFAGIDRPCIGVHVLQACGRRHGYAIHVLYANILYCARIGMEAYNRIAYSPTTNLLGERIFSKHLYNLESFSSDKLFSSSSYPRKRVPKDGSLEISMRRLEEISNDAGEFILQLSRYASSLGYAVTGSTSTFEQTNAGLAILKSVKELSPETTTIMGGGNCEGDLCNGINDLAANHLGDCVDYIFSGECEKAFPQFLASHRVNRLPGTKIIKGDPHEDLDSLPCMDYSEYYDQLFEFVPDFPRDRMWMPFETSRGCWWGEKNQCLFCGINGQTIRYRQRGRKNAAKELKRLYDKHPSNLVCMVDNVMPKSYFDTFLPAIRATMPDAHIFYEQRANLNLEQVQRLKEAGVNIIQPGIESLSTSLLQLMRKGVSAKQNLNLLRYCRSVGVAVNWNLLFGFPGDKEEYYREMIDLIPHVSHLFPPGGVFHLSIDRFSPYFDHPEAFGISNVVPMAAYRHVFPPGASHDLAYHFAGEYKSFSKGGNGVVARLSDLVEHWRQRWNGKDAPPPSLSLGQLGEDAFMLLDSRNEANGPCFAFLAKEQAAVCMHPPDRGNGELVEWALENNYGALVDGRYVPLCTAGPQLFQALAPSASSL